jgi:hypothetical protein
VKVADALLDTRFGDGRVVASRDEALLRVPRIGTFRVAGGETVVEPAPEADEASVTALLESTVRAFALAQRGMFALHAGAVSIGGRAVAVCGDRGAGKSTTVLALAQRGHALLADDVCPLEVSGPGVVHRPARRATRVAPETAEALGLDLPGASLPGADGKLVFPGAEVEPGPLAGVVVLRVGDGAQVQRESLSGAEAARAVQANVYRVRLLVRVWPAEMFAWAAAVADRLPVSELSRPRSGWTAGAVASAVEDAAYSIGC